MQKLLSREEYKNHLEEIKNISCRFCESDTQIIIKEFKYFKWIFNIAPYYKYHTMLIPDRHILKITDMTADEWQEWKTIHEHIKGKFKQEFGTNQLMVMVREFYGDTDKVEYYKPEHLHISYINDKIGDFEKLNLDLTAKDVDFKNFIKIINS